MKSRQWYLVQKVGNPRKKNVIKVKEPKEVTVVELIRLLISIFERQTRMCHSALKIWEYV
jgi:hypothetical protein